MSTIDVPRSGRRGRPLPKGRVVDAGALAEVRALAARGLDPALPAMKAHGVPWLMRHLRGEITLAEAAEGGKRDTRHYAKRQHTWFRHQLPEWTWAAPEAARGLIETALRGDKTGPCA